MFRLLVLIAVVAVGYDAIVHHGLYTRNAWASVVEVTDSAVSSARQFGEGTRDENRQIN
jgi:hypothetical protein